MRRAVVVTRWLLACVLAAWTARQLFIAGTTEVQATGMLRGFFGIAGILATVLLAAPELVGWAVLPFHRVVDSILLPSESEPPPADYTLARFYLQQMRYEEACEEYLKIIRYHPRELPAYFEGIMTAGQAQQPGLAEKFYRRGRRAFRGEEVRRRLEATLEDSLRTAATLAAMAEAPAGETGGVPALEPAEDSTTPPPPEP